MKALALFSILTTSFAASAADAPRDCLRFAEKTAIRYMEEHTSCARNPDVLASWKVSSAVVSENVAEETYLVDLESHCPGYARYEVLVKHAANRCSRISVKLIADE